ncbi:MAG: hypothetical protein A2W64_03920 [Candidatus Zambryskibacteria bacterium RIFCSPLOWO2_02_39_10]|nr:MAG: hypothetical protein A2W64_03920 [Candidatus Zambryskibacteria bacterium RIFCSPLOWO2_02_39_10]
MKSELILSKILMPTNLRASSAPFGRGSKNQKFSLPFLFSSAGVWGGIRAGFDFLFWRNSGRLSIKELV